MEYAEPGAGYNSLKNLFTFDFGFSRRACGDYHLTSLICLKHNS
jgi:hypothetical protein